MRFWISASGQGLGSTANPGERFKTRGITGVYGEMDDTDRRLMYLIFEDPRMPFRDLAKRLGVSRQAVHNRLRILEDLGVFRSIKATFSVHYLNCMAVSIWGRSKTGSLQDTLNRLGESEFTSRVDVLGGNQLSVLGCLRNMTELDGFVEFVKGAAEMPEPTVGILSLLDGINPEFYDGGPKREEYRTLSPLDLRIIAALHDDARKPVTQIAQEVGISAKTVKRHIDRMRSEGSLDFDAPLDIPSGEEMVTVMYLKLRPGANKLKVAHRLLSKDPIHMVYFRAYSNLPNFLSGLILSDRMSVIRRDLAFARGDEDVLDVTPNVIYSEHYYDSWDYRLIKRAGDLTKKAKKSSRDRS